MPVWFCYDLIHYRHWVLFVNSVCCLIFVIVFRVVLISTRFICHLGFHLSFMEWYVCFRNFSISSSFGFQLSQECGWAGLEPYERTHITEPLYLYLYIFIYIYIYIYIYLFIFIYIYIYIYILYLYIYIYIILLFWLHFCGGGTI